jgi:DNA-binding protein H-NS
MVDKVDLSSYSLDELRKLSNRVEQEIERQRKSKVLTIRTKMEELASTLGMTVEEVVNQEKKKRNAKIMSHPKYRNPHDPSQTWAGRGKRPRWLQQALQKGAQLDDFVV